MARKKKHKKKKRNKKKFSIPKPEWLRGKKEEKKSDAEDGSNKSFAIPEPPWKKEEKKLTKKNKKTKSKLEKKVPITVKSSKTNTSKKEAKKSKTKDSQKQPKKSTASNIQKAKKLTFKKFFGILFLAWVILILDQGTKMLAQLFLLPVEGYDYTFFSLEYTTNTGAAFGMFSDSLPTLAALSGIVVGLMILVPIVALLFGKTFVGKQLSKLFQGRTNAIIYALILGGAAGNLIDRAIRRYVIDFIDISWWATFNVADMAISLAVFIMVIAGVWDWYVEFREKKKAVGNKKQDS